MKIKKTKKKLLSLTLALTMMLTFVTVAQASTTNLALNATVSAQNAHSSYPASYAIDGNTATRWQSTQTSAWYLIDLKEVKAFDKIVITHLAAANAQAITTLRATAADTVVVSGDTVTLTGDVLLTTVGTSSERKQILTFGKVEKRYIYFQFVTTGRPAVSEFEVYDISLTNLSISDDYESVFIPGAGEEANISAAPMVSVTDEQSDTYVARSGDIVWSLPESPAGVTIDSATGDVSISSSAAAGTVTVRATLADDNSVYVEKTLELIAAGGEDDPAELSYTNGYGTVTIPAEGAEAIVISNDVSAKNSDGDVIDSADYTLSYVLNGGNAINGVTIDSATGAVTVTDSALDGVYEVTASVAGNDAVAVTIPLNIGVDINTAKDSSNLALNVSVTATSNHNIHVPTQAVDGDAGTKWQALSGDKNPTISIDMGNMRYINRVSVLADSSIGNNIKIEAADDSEFTVNLRTLGEGVIEEANCEFAFPTTRTRYVRLSVTEKVTNTFAVNEIGIYRTKAVNIATWDVENMELFMPTEGSFTYTNTGAYPIDATGACVNTTDFPVKHELTSSALNGVTLNEATGAITVAADAVEGEIEITATLAADETKTKKYTIYIADATKQYTESLNDNYALSNITLVDANDEETTRISTAAALNVEIMGLNPEKSNKVTAIVLVYENSEKSTAPVVHIKKVDIKEFELGLYQIDMTDISGLADGCVNILLWDGMEKLVPIVEKLSY